MGANTSTEVIDNQVDNNMLTGSVNVPAPSTSNNLTDLTQSDLDCLVKCLITKYKQEISEIKQDEQSKQLNYLPKFNSVRDRLLNEFNAKCQNQQPNKIGLVFFYYNKLSKLMDSENTKYQADVQDVSNKNKKVYYNIVETCVEEYTNKIIELIEKDTDQDGFNNNFILLNKTAFKYAMSKFEINQQLKSSLIQNLSLCSIKYKDLYTCNEEYQDKCKQKILSDRYCNPNKLVDIKSEVYIPETIESSQYLKQCLNIMYNKSEQYFRNKLLKGNQGENRLSENALNNDKYEHNMVNHLRDKPFVDPNKLSHHSNTLIDSLETKFSCLKMSTNGSVVRVLNGQLSPELEVMYKLKPEANNNRRLTAANDLIGQLVNDFKSELNAYIADSTDIYLTDHTATKIADITCEHILNKFDHFCEPTDHPMFALHKQRLLKQLVSEANDFKAYNSQHNRDLIADCDITLAKAKSEYDQTMDNLFNSPDKLYTDIELDTLHQNLVQVLKNNFTKYDLNDDIVAIDDYKNKLDTYTMDKYKLHQENNRKQYNKTNLMNNLVYKYEDELTEWIKASSNKNNADFLTHSQLIANQIIAENGLKYAKIIDFEQLAKQFDSTQLEMLDVFRNRVDSQRKLERDLMGRVLHWYYDEMGQLYTDTSYIRPDTLKTKHQTLLNKAMDIFKHNQGDITEERLKELLERYLQIAFEYCLKENYKNAPTTVAIGIHLGTNNSCVAYFKPGRYNKGKVIVCKNIRNSDVTPNFVEILPNDEVVVGDEAKENLHHNPRNTIHSVQRIIGRPYNDPELQQDMLLWPFEVLDDGNNHPVIEVDVDGMSQQYYPEEISAHVLRRMREIAEREVGHPIMDAVITVPAYFNDAQREATKEAGIIAGLNVLNIINEPMAAALAYKLDKFDSINNRNVLVYNFGDERFDVSVLKIEMGQIEVLGKGGNNHLGVDGIDNKIIDYCLQDFYAQTGILIDRNSVGGQRALRALRYRCERVIWELIEITETTIRVDNIIDNRHLEVTLSRHQFEDMNKDLFKQTIDCVDKVLHEINDGLGLHKEDIDEIILIGRSTNIPYVKTIINEYFNGKRPKKSVNPIHTVAEGAALQAAILNGKQAQHTGNLLIRDVLPFSLGVCCGGDKMTWIMNAQSPIDGIPITRAYSTTQDYQTEIEVKVYEGEDQVASRNKLLAIFTITNIRPDKAGKQKILIMFHINDEGILKVRAKVLGQKVNAIEIEIKEYKGRLSVEEILMRRRH